MKIDDEVADVVGKEECIFGAILSALTMGKKHNALSFKYLALKSSFSSRHLLSLTGNSLPRTPWFGITFKLQAIYGIILS